MRKKIDIVIFVLVLLFGGWALKNAEAVGDWVHARRYSPSVDIIKLADDAGMSAEGKKLFYRFSPQIVDEQTLTSLCGAEKYGCTEGRSIYILQASSDAEYNRNVVTAAHEMLHVAYSRLSSSQKATLASLLKSELPKPAAAGIVTELRGYPAGDYYNEAHSFIGSQVSGVSSVLETYYNQYFNDRSKSTTAYTASPEE